MKNILEQYGLVPDDLYYSTGTRLNVLGYKKLLKDESITHKEYTVSTSLTPLQMLQLGSALEFPYFIKTSRIDKKTHIVIFGDNINIILRLLGDDIEKWLDMYIQHRYNI